MQMQSKIDELQAQVEMLMAQNATLMQMNQHQSIRVWKAEAKCKQLTLALQKKTELCEEYGKYGNTQVQTQSKRRITVKKKVINPKVPRVSIAEEFETLPSSSLSYLLVHGQM